MYDTVKKTIEICSQGKVLSRIIFGGSLDGVAGCLEGYNDIHIVCDGNAGQYAMKVARALLPPDDAGCEGDGCHHGEGDGCHHVEGHDCCHEKSEGNCSHEENGGGHHCCHGGGGCGRRRLLGGRVKSITGIQASEAAKTIETATAICARLLDEGADRSSLLLAIGGGITTDLAGFAACIYKRGIRFAFIPTTLLAQVDAGIGGKTGVNYQGLKNMLGVIRQPEFTYICPEVLETLPEREFLCGEAEMLKTFIIQDINCDYEKAVSLFSGLRDTSVMSESEVMECYETLATLIMDAASVKAEIVSRDQFEGGERRKLNLGHTFAHAIEKLSDGEIAHGEAVAMGIILAARLSDKELAGKIEADFKACGLRVECPYGMDEMAGIISKDKKAEGGIVHFIIPEAIGRVVEKDIAPENINI